MNENKLGAIYLAFGTPYLSMALYSVRTLRSKNPSMPVCIVTNVKFDIRSVDYLDEARDTIIYIEKDTSSNRDIKTRINEYSPYDETIFLDCDTVIVNDLSDASVILKYFDAAFRLNRYPQTRKGKGDINILDNNPVSLFPHWNSGVILFRKNGEGTSFFTEWNKNFNRIGAKYDQVSLVETIFSSTARVLSLDEKWNSVDPIIGRKKWLKIAKVFHYGTNISDGIISKVIAEAARALPESELAIVKKALLEKRMLKKKQGFVKYMGAMVVWKFWHPF